MDRRPDFVLVGAPKCATGTIYELLGRRPRTFLAPKDLYFFGSDLATAWPRLSEAEYRARFEAAPAGAVLGDASVGYLSSERAAGEIHAFCPDARIVIALRNPLDAIPSLHRHCLYYGLEEIEDLGAALEAEEDRARGRRLPRRCAHPWMLRYTHVYRYAGQLRRYFDAFGRGRCHVVVYDDFRADPGGAMDALGSFLRRRAGGAAGQPRQAGAQPAAQRPAHRPAGGGAAGRAGPDAAAAAAPPRRGSARRKHGRRGSARRRPGRARRAGGPLRRRGGADLRAARPRPRPLAVGSPTDRAGGRLAPCPASSI